MIEIKLSEDYEMISKDNPFGLKYSPLKHQFETYQALQNNEIVINLHNTGTGKTLASLLYLFDLNQKGENVLFIAPTNELIYQHAEDIKEFVADNNLEFNVIRIDASILRSLTSYTKRNGDKLHQLLENPRKFADELNLEFIDKRYPFVFVTNPDIFYYGLYFQYQDKDQRNLCQDFASLFSYIVIDEFHYYNPKQFANFLFFFALSKKFGYFDEGRRICLLSATPAQYVVDYLKRLELNLEIIDFEFDINSKDKLQTLTKAEVKIAKGNLEEQFDLIEKEAISYLKSGLDGVIIGNSLIRINKAHFRVKWEDKGKITGPESREKREEANQKSLILATPTVDIGYNFKKENKQRQNIDFVITEANSLDELLQRIGRAGRVLGKKVQDRASKILILVDEKSYDTLERGLEAGKEYQRSEFADLLVELNAPAQKREFIRYIRSYAMLETFYPLYELYCMMADEDKGYVEELFEFLQAIFGGNKSFRQLKGITGGFRHQKQVVEDSKDLRIKDYRDFYEWLTNQRVTNEQLKKERALESKIFYRNTVEFINQQYASKQSLFNFRDSFSGPQAVIYDPKGIFISDKVGSYDLLHILRNYNYALYDNQEEFSKATGSSLEGDFYLKLLSFREEKLKISYRIDLPYIDLFTTIDRNQKRNFFEEKFCNRPTALKGLEIVASEALDPKIRSYFKEEYIPMMIVVEELDSSLFSNVSDSQIYPVDVEVSFTRPREYKAILGTAAFLVYPEMRGAIYASKKREELPIII
ncbi:CRISPR-associated endonuclease/helicase Cas3 [Orenia metallireducens]|uniref:CRISPR-associated endonuclease/helicase Cas3 n=1 Tax=Orenia metallireducens TaxID=1413210 RepID=A0A285HZI7_9FIRM|nr:type I-D CRISPR-associated helicase Cas3' [Orenia metallireducens]SNY41142.1 CRISPR-associated endonuclease/helicase Cas3 [Orenia metallireducens]